MNTITRKRRKTFGVEKKTIAERFWSKVDKKGIDECWQWKGAVSVKGYGYLGGTRGMKPIIAHRLSYQIQHGVVVPGDMCACHKCDNPRCVNPHHIFLGTRADNVADMIAKGRQKDNSGENNPRSKLTKKDVETVHEMRSNGKTQQAIADHFGVSQVAISLILRGINWKK